MTKVHFKCIVCGDKFEDELRPYLGGKLEICQKCVRIRERDEEIEKYLKKINNNEYV